MSKPTKSDYYLVRSATNTFYKTPLFSLHSLKKGAFPMQKEKQKEFIFTVRSEFETMSVFISRDEAAYVLSQKFRAVRKTLA